MAIDRSDALWTAKIAAYLLGAHAVAYLAHEYAHSLSAWALGWMAAPFALDYGPASLTNWILLGGVSDNVDYDPIFRHGSGIAAAGIALAGPFIGNGLLYLLVVAGARRWLAAGRQAAPFCLALMGAGNLWSYVPIRSLTTHADIALAARGFGIGVGALFPFVLAPTLAIGWHFYRACTCWWFPLLSNGSGARYALLCAATSYWFFAFFGGAAQGGGYGGISQALSDASVYLLFPLGVTLLWMAKPATVPAPRG